MNKELNILIKEKSFWKYSNNSKFHAKTIKDGFHSDAYLNTDHIVEDVKLIEQIVKEVFVKELISRKIKPDWIITFPPFGLPIAYELARQTNTKFGYIDVKNSVCNFNIQKGDTVVIVNDDIYTGGSIKKIIQIMQNLGAKIEGPIFSISNFSQSDTFMDFEVVSIVKEKINLYEENNCPMCKAGSKAISPRLNWQTLIKDN